MLSHNWPRISRFAQNAVVLIVILMTVFGSGSCSPGSYSGPIETLTIAIVPTEINALLYIAEARNSFASNGLQVILKEEYDSGAAAAIGMLNGEADIASAAEFPMVRQIFNKKDIVNFGTIARYENTYMLWRTDSGIKTVEGLKGKKIGVTLQTISAFYLGRTLDLHGMNIHQVTIVDVKAADAEKALVSNEVDAVVTWEPWVNQINERMGTEVTTTAVQSSQYAYWNLVATTDWINGHPDTIKRLIDSLAQAEDYVASHQAEAKEIIGKRMNFDDAYLEMIWKRYQFSLSLDQSLITAMEDEARWMIANGLTPETEVPDFLDYIYMDALETVQPEAVNIIR
ncbi:MAG TPA: ABC transporter substrate-binding protein [Anaerolineales bacterium]|nr:ABC transporter substrate-binding protein [Anaerolineales bacterium]